MPKPLWKTDYHKFRSLSLPERLELLRKYFCTGPSGQGSDSQVATANLDADLKIAIQFLRMHMEEVCSGSQVTNTSETTTSG